MTRKFDNFVRALDNLCREHAVQLSTSGYDSLEVHDLPWYIDNDYLDSPIYGGFDGVKDCTKE